MLLANVNKKWHRWQSYLPICSAAALVLPALPLTESENKFFLFENVLKLKHFFIFLLAKLYCFRFSITTEFEMLLTFLLAGISIVSLTMSFDLISQNPLMPNEISPTGYRFWQVRNSGKITADTMWHFRYNGRRISDKSSNDELLPKFCEHCTRGPQHHLVKI